MWRCTGSLLGRATSHEGRALVYKFSCPYNFSCPRREVDLLRIFLIPFHGPRQLEGLEAWLRAATLVALPPWGAGPWEGQDFPLWIQIKPSDLDFSPQKVFEVLGVPILVFLLMSS